MDPPVNRTPDAQAGTDRPDASVVPDRTLISDRLPAPPLPSDDLGLLGLHGVGDLAADQRLGLLLRCVQQTPREGGEKRTNRKPAGDPRRKRPTSHSQLHQRDGMRLNRNCTLTIWP